MRTLLFILATLFTAPADSSAHNLPAGDRFFYLYGTWVCYLSTNEGTFKLTWEIFENGEYRFLSQINGEIANYAEGEWAIENNVICQNNHLTEETACGSIQWIHQNYMVLTVLFNGDSGNSGQQRHYFRQF